MPLTPIEPAIASPTAPALEATVLAERHEPVLAFLFGTTKAPR